MTRKRTEMNWLRMETRLREALQNYDTDRVEGRDTSESTIFLIDEIIAEETGRGNSIKNEEGW